MNLLKKILFIGVCCVLASLCNVATVLYAECCDSKSQIGVSCKKDGTCSPKHCSYRYICTQCKSNVGKSPKVISHAPRLLDPTNKYAVVPFDLGSGICPHATCKELGHLATEHNCDENGNLLTGPNDLYIDPNC